MLPAFDNICHFTDHGEASYFQVRAFTVVEVTRWGQFILAPFNSVRPTEQVMFGDEASLNRVASLFAH